MTADLAFGITAAQRDGSQGLAAKVESLGYAELWVNDTKAGDGLATIAALAPPTRDLRFGVGVIALSEFEPADIADRVSAVAVPQDRLTVGVGSGSSASLELVRRGISGLRAILDLPIAVAAVGPRMAELGGELADAVVANWALPDRLGWLRGRIAEGAGRASRTPPRLVAYVRVAVGPGADERLADEMARYRGHGDGPYARAFAVQASGPIGIALPQADPGELHARLAPYRAVADTVVVRGLPATDDADAWLEIARAAADQDG